MKFAIAAATAGAVLWFWVAAPWADGNDRWHLVADQSSVTYGQVVATGENEAWAFGWKILGIGAWIPMADGPHRPTVFHWNDGRWRKTDFPVEVGTVGQVAASAPDDVWALVGTSVVRWDGRTWAIAHEFSGPVMALSVVAADDVWVFGDRRTWHYNGATWTEQAVPFTAWRVSARSASDIWALDGEAARVHHFDGGTWTPIDLTPALPKAPPASDPLPPDLLNAPHLRAITADETGVWITGEIGMSSFLLSWTGSGWRTEDTSATAGRMGRALPPVPDGRGGHWLLGSTDVNGNASALAHRDPSGRWSRVPSGGELTSLSAVPGGPLLATGQIGRATGVFRHLP
ncbi:hypothetical protein GCM10009560_26710 [Nonomuraea longicatena]|uniref:Uncharacterized protein n=2 Tax=Nonomuraea longicatena TaxID=83682 RepID=A0ABP3ZRD3_9ACTN